MTTPLWLENIGPEYNAREYRNLLKAMCEDTGGVARQGDLKVSQRTAGANMSVDVSGGDGFVLGTESPTQGAYFVHYDGVTNLPIATANGSNPRNDMVCVRMQDSEYSGTTDSIGGAGDLTVVAGTPAATPVDPSVPNNCLRLARVRVGTAASSITNANITDLRQLAPPAKNARGRLVYKVFGTDTGLIDDAALKVVNGSLVTVNVELGRRLLLRADLDFRSSQLTDSATIHFRLDGGNVSGTNTGPILVGAQDIGVQVFADISPTAGTHDIDMTAIRISGTGLCRIQSTSSISVYDEGGRIA